MMLFKGDGGTIHSGHNLRSLNIGLKSRRRKPKDHSAPTRDLRYRNLHITSKQITHDEYHGLVIHRLIVTPIPTCGLTSLEPTLEHIHLPLILQEEHQLDGYLSHHLRLLPDLHHTIVAAPVYGAVSRPLLPSPLSDQCIIKRVFPKHHLPHQSQHL